MYLLLSATLAQWNFAWMLLHTDRLLNSSTDCKFAWKTTEREKMTGKIINEGFCNYSRTTPQRLPWGRRKLAVVERWPLGGSTALKKKEKIQHVPDLVLLTFIDISVHFDTYFCITALSVLEDGTFSFSSFNFCRIGQKSGYKRQATNHIQDSVKADSH